MNNLNIKIMNLIVYFFVSYFVCVILYSVIARYTIYKGNVYVKLSAIVKEGAVDFGKIFTVILSICGVIIGINYVRVLWFI